MNNTVSQLIYDSYKGSIPTKYATMDKSVREEAIRKEFLGVLGLETFEKNTFRKAFRENKAKVFSIIEDIADQVMVDGEYQRNTFFNQFVEIKNLALGDKNEFYVDVKNQLEVSEFSGSHWDLKRRRVDVGQSFSLEMRNFGIKVYEEIERIMSGRADFAKLVSFIIDAVERKLADIAQTTFATAINNLPAEFTATGSYNEAKILEVLQHVQASSTIKPTIVGTSVGLAKLQNKSTIQVSDNMADEKNRQGYLTVWNGYPCMEIAQGHKIGGFDFTMDNNKLYALVGGDKLVKICLEGETEVNEIADGTTNADRTTEYTLQFRAGSAVAYSDLIGYIELA
jgi:hypothetical protein